MISIPITLSIAIALQPAVADDWTPSPDEAAVYRALSARDPVACAEVEALAAEPLAALRTVVERAAMPPWAPMRAAHCIVEGHATEARDDLLSWVGSEQTRGLALQLLSELDSVDEPLALEIAGAALAGPLADEARPRLAQSEVPSVKALAAER